jgi:uncharacterized membrane protein
MNLAHIHILLNHFPTIGTIVGLGLFVVALFGKSEDLKRASLGIFLVIGLLTIPAYLTGNMAEDVLRDGPTYSEAYVHRHQDAALLAFIFMQTTAGLSWFGLWQYRRIARTTTWNLSAVLVFSLISFGLMAQAASLGGEISHLEIREGPEVVATEGVLGWSTALGEWFVGQTWAWTAAETLHFIGMWLLFGVVLMVNLRMLGVIKKISYAAMHRMLPWGVLGFTLNMITGMLFFVSAPGYYTQNISFYAKVGLMVIAGINTLYFTIFDDTWNLKAEDEAPMSGKVMAASTIALWFGVIYFGRMLPFLGNSF